MPEKTIKIHLTLNITQIRFLRKKAEKTGQKVNDVIRQFIAKQIENENE